MDRIEEPLDKAWVRELMDVVLKFKIPYIAVS
jgi:hypothetical protein